MTKLTEMHLERAAAVYMRQSSKQQVKEHKESQISQYKLKEYAKKIGFRKIIVIDEDLGKTGTGVVDRKGFEGLLTDLCERKIGAVFVIAASRLARNGREWHTLLDICGYVGALIIDPHGIYDPNNANDRLLLGIRGTLSEMEVRDLIERAQRSINQKAQRGELYRLVAVGYALVSDKKLEKDPNRRVQEAIELLFKKFNEKRSARQVYKWFDQEKILFPKIEYKDKKRIVVWQVPGYDIILTILKNPVYAGAYAYGRRSTKIKVDIHGRKRKKIIRNDNDISKWKVLIKEHHKGYISWDEYERNQKILISNTNMKGILVKGAVRKGSGLLSGLLRCGHCGRRLQVSYGGTRGSCVRYFCMRNEDSCMTFGGYRVEKAVEKTVMEVLSPMGIEASCLAIKKVEKGNIEIKKQMGLALEQARYEADRAFRQYDSVDPENRIVVYELEKRWNNALKEVEKLEEQFKGVEKPLTLSEEEKEELVLLGSDISYVWNHQNGSFEIKKQIMRIIFKEIVVKIEDGKIKLILHWEGGDHSKIEVKKYKVGENHLKSDEETVTLIKELSRIETNQEISSFLNRIGRKTARGKSWTAPNVQVFQKRYNIMKYQEGELAGRGEILVKEAAEKLGVSRKIIYHLIKEKILPAKQIIKGAPWIIKQKDIELKEVQWAIHMVLEGKKLPLPDESQMLFSFDIRS